MARGTSPCRVRRDGWNPKGDGEAAAAAAAAAAPAVFVVKPLVRLERVATKAIAGRLYPHASATSVTAAR